ncbi:MAG: hypothetical protein U1E94_02795 [Agitococcus sp.]
MCRTSLLNPPDKQTAIQEWKHLEYKFSHKMGFENVTEFEQLFFFLERLGMDANKAFFENLHVMNQDELFELIEKLERHVFYMYEYPADLKLKTLFNLTENRFESWDATEELWDGTEGLPNNIIITNDSVTEITINGTLEELTDAPLLLNQLIEQDPNLDYDNLNKILKIQPDEQSLNSVNALLKNPLYEIHYLTIQEIYEIEQTLNKKL